MRFQIKQYQHKYVWFENITFFIIGWTNDAYLSVGRLGGDLNEIFYKKEVVSFGKVCLTSAKK